MTRVFTCTFIIACILGFVSCKKKTETKTASNTGKESATKTYTNAFIINGGDVNGKGEISSSDSTLTVINDAYKNVNGATIGANVNSATVVGGYLYVACTNPDKILILNAKTLALVKVLQGADVVNPQYVLPYADLAYVSCWGLVSDSSNVTGSYLLVIDAGKQSIKSKIAVPGGPTKMDRVGVYIYASLKFKKEISIIDIQMDKVVKNKSFNASVGDIVADSLQRVWFTLVSSSLFPVSSNDQGVGVINSEYQTDDESILFPVSVGSAGTFAYNTNKTEIWVSTNDGGGKVHKIDISSKRLDYSPVISASSISKIDYNPRTNRLYVLKSNGANANGELSVYTSSGSKLSSSAVGILPRNTVFFTYTAYAD